MRILTSGPMSTLAKRRHVVGAIAALTLAGLPTFAFPQSDSTPAEVSEIPNAKLVGEGTLTFLTLPIYDAKLWASPTFSPQNYAMHPFALQLAYLRDFKGEDIAQRSMSEMQRGGKISDEQYARWLGQMRIAFPDIKKGDRIVGLNRPGVGAVFFVNGKQSNEVKEPEFARLFFGIWLGPKTSEPELRKALISLL